MTEYALDCEEWLDSPAVMKFSNVTADAKANIYFEGQVVSHSIVLQDGSKKTLGIIYPGTYYFSTDSAERMEIIDGSCAVQLDEIDGWDRFTAGEHFDVPAKSGFSIEVSGGICQYICSFID